MVMAAVGDRQSNHNERRAGGTRAHGRRRGSVQAASGFQSRVEVTVDETVVTARTGLIQIKPGEQGRLIVQVPYGPGRVAKIKTVGGRRWYPKEQYWTVPHTDGTIAHLLTLFAGERVAVDPSLRPVKVLNNQAPPPGQEIPEDPTLLDQVRQAIRTRHLSSSTEQAYVSWIKRFIFFYGKRHPAEMGEAEIARFLSSLATDSRVSASTQNQALNALLFLYNEVME